MYDVKAHDVGGYRFIPAMFQYSGGVASERGYRIERARLFAPLGLGFAFEFVRDHLRQLGRPMGAFCACELRSPEPFSENGFFEFNKFYAGKLDSHGLVTGGVNPIARTNVCPEVDGPAEVQLYGFSYTVPDTRNSRPSFVVSGSGEAPEGKGNYRDYAIRLGDRSLAGIREKADWVLGEMTRRLESLGAGWGDATGVHVYTVHEIHHFLPDLMVSRGVARRGLSWHFTRPPVADLDYEMDVRGVSHELVV